MKKLIISIFAIMATISSTQAADKVLVAYFSATGTTKAAAELVARATNGELMAIEPTKAYTSADLNWHNQQSRSSVEMNDPTARPAIKKSKENLDGYSTIYLGFPIWWYVAPRIINTFLEAYDFTGKTIIPFATSGSSNISGAVKALRQTYPTLKIDDGRLLNSVSYDDIVKWTKR